LAEDDAVDIIGRSTKIFTLFMEQFSYIYNLMKT